MLPSVTLGRRTRSEVASCFRKRNSTFVRPFVVQALQGPRGPHVVRQARILHPPRGNGRPPRVFAARVVSMRYAPTMVNLRFGVVGVLVVASFVLASACGTVADAGDAGADSGTPSDSGVREDASSTDGAVGEDAGEAGACVPSPTIGSPCIPGQVTCDVVDACCAGILSCEASSRTWRSLGLGCPCRSTPCGDKTCGGNQFCRARSAGIPAPDGGTLPDTYECVDFPPACARTWTCECLAKVSDPACPQAPQASCTIVNDRPLQRCMGQ